MRSLRRPLAAHLAAGPAGRGRQRRHERLRPRAGRRRWPRPASTATSTSGAGADDLPDEVRGRARLPGRPRRRRPGRPAQGGAARRSSTSSPTACSTHIERDRRRRRHPRQLLAVGRGRPPPQARARPAAGVDVPHPGPGQGRDRRRRARSAGSTPRPRSSAAPTPSSPSCAAEADQLERLYGADPSRIEIVPPGVDHAFFSPGDQRRRPRARSGSRRTGPVLLFVGRIQPLKGLDVAVGALADAAPTATPCSSSSAARAAPTARPSSPGSTTWPTSSASSDRVRFVAAAAPPPAVDLLPGRRRVPRAEPLGVVRARRPRGGRLRHARSWPPRSAGCARSSTTARTGFLVEGRDPADFAAARRRAARRPGSRAARWARRPPRRARGYTWSTAAARLRRALRRPHPRQLVDCA